MQEIHKLRQQISRIVQMTFPGVDAGFVPKLAPPNETQVRSFPFARLDFRPLTSSSFAQQLKVLRQLLTAAFIDQVAVRKDLVDKTSNLSFAKVASTRGVAYRAFGIDEDLFIHPSSNLFHSSPPEFIVFNELHRTHKVWLKSASLFLFRFLRSDPFSRLTSARAPLLARSHHQGQPGLAPRPRSPDVHLQQARRDARASPRRQSRLERVGRIRLAHHHRRSTVRARRRHRAQARADDAEADRRALGPAVEREGRIVLL